MSLTLSDVQFLDAHRDAALEASFELTAGSSLDDAAKARREFGQWGRAVLEWAAARKQAVGKLPEEWLVDHDSAQQATQRDVAQVRAQRLARQVPGGVVHDVTCSIGTEALSLVDEGLSYLGSDVDPVRARMAHLNTQDFPVTTILRADALRPVSRPDVVVADPARRTQGRRLTRPDQLLPPLGDLLQAWKGTPLAVKCAPGIDYSQWPGLASVVSVDGAVKETCLYTSDLAEGLRREAVVLRGGQRDVLTDRDPGDVGTGDPGEYIIDPDGAVVRAGLVRQYAFREGLWMLDERIAHLTGDRIPQGMSGFKILERVPVKKVRQALRSYHCGSVEILVRGVQVDPDQLRKKWKLSGDRAMAVVVTRIGSAGVAFICESRELSCLEN